MNGDALLALADLLEVAERLGVVDASDDADAIEAKLEALAAEGEESFS